MIASILALVTIHVIPTWLMLPWMGTACGTWPYGWYYDTINKVVYACEVKNADVSSQMILDHEIGHFIQDNLITDKEWADYEKEWNKSIKKGTWQFLRDYGTVSALEGFSEDIMYIQAWQYKNPRNPQVRKRIAVVNKILNRLK